MLTLMLVVALLQSPDKVLAKAQKTLADKPDDPEANQVVAVHLSTSGDWEKALPCFAKAKTEALRLAAAAEAKDDGNKFTFVEIGDAWAGAAQKAPGARQSCIDRASFWYGKGYPQLDPIWQEKLRAKLDRLYAPPMPGRAGGLPAGWGGAIDGKCKAELVSSKVHSGGAAAKLKPPGDGGLSSVMRAPAIAIPPGSKTIEVSAWLLTDGTDHPAEGFGAHISGGAKLLTSMVLVTPPNIPVWTRVRQEIPVPEGATSVQLDFVLGSKKGFLYVDDVSVKLDGKELLPSGSFEGK